MDLKKNPNVDINKDRLVYRAVGYVFVFAITFLMFSFTFFEKKKVKLKSIIMTDDAEQVENTQHEAAPPPPPPPPTLQIVEDVEEETNEFQSTEFEEEEKIEEIIVTDNTKEKVEEIDDEKIYEGDLEKDVSFKGGEEALLQFLEENTVYPEAARLNEITGVIIVTFVVEKNGTISNITTDGKGDKDLEREAKRVISKTNGMWSPGEFKKKPVRQICRIPITFEITDEE